MTETNHVLEVEHLSVEYQDSTLFGKKTSYQALKDVTFHVNQGEILGLVGESGCGKSTLSKAILGMLDTARIEGEIRHFTKRPQMVFQDPFGSLNPAKTVGWILEEPLRIFGKYDEAERKRRVLDMLERVGLERDYANRKPSELSGGQRQRVSIATALIQRPKFILADEPVSALDVTIQAQVIAMMKKLRDDRGMSMIMITHDLGIIADVCDEVAIMYAGRIIEYGTLRDVFNHTKHPYTEGLFNSLPNIRNRSERLKPIPGLMPDPSNLPKGCAFAPRCRYCTAACLEKRPEDRMVSDTHMVACTAYDNPDFRIDRPEKN